MSDLSTIFAAMLQAAKADALPLFLIVGALVYQTRELRRIAKQHMSCSRDLQAVRIAVARLHALIQAERGQSDPLPPLADMMADRRQAERDHA